MTNPEKVIGFLSITHNWDASLIFVMGGAIIVTAPFFYLLRNKNKSLLGLDIDLPQKKDLDKNVLKVFDVKNSVNLKSSYGGTSINNIKKMISKLKKEFK